MKGPAPAQRGVHGYELPVPQIVTRELADRRAAHEFHVALNLCAQKAEGALNAGLARRPQRVEVIASDAHGFRPK